jgi:hypothetical protein
MTDVHWQRVVLIPSCEECLKLWLPIDDERWKALWADDAGSEQRLLFYCPDFAEREFV